MSRRTDRLGSMIQQELMEIIMRELNDPRLTGMPSITRVKVSEDLSMADVYITSMGTAGQQTAALLFADEFINKRRAVAQKFMNAYIRALRDYNDALKDGRIAGPGADEIVAILTKYTRVKDAKVYRDMTPFAANPDGHVNKASLQNDWDFFKSRGLISGHVTVDQVIDNSFADEAVHRLGVYKRKS